MTSGQRSQHWNLDNPTFDASLEQDVGTFPPNSAWKRPGKLVLTKSKNELIQQNGGKFSPLWSPSASASS